MPLSRGKNKQKAQKSQQAAAASPKKKSQEAAQAKAQPQQRQQRQDKRAASSANDGTQQEEKGASQTEPDLAALEAELSALNPSARKKRAAAAGATEREIEDAEDAEDSQGAMVALILSHEQPGDSGKGTAGDEGGGQSDQSANASGSNAHSPDGEKTQGRSEEPDRETKDYEGMRPFQLKDECGKKGLSKEGNKEELMQRLKDHDAGTGDQRNERQGDPDSPPTAAEERLRADHRGGADKPEYAPSEGSVSGSITLEAELPTAAKQASFKQAIIRDLAGKMGVDESRIRITSLDMVEVEVGIQPSRRKSGIDEDDHQGDADAPSSQRDVGDLGTSGLAVLEAELSALKPSARKKRAAAAGATEREIEDAEDAEDSEGAMIALILSHEQPGDSGKDDRKEALRTELAAMKNSARMKRAKAAGVSDREIDEAEDDDDPQSAIIELIIAHETSTSGPDDNERTAALEAELSALKPSARKKRAAAASPWTRWLSTSTARAWPRATKISSATWALRCGSWSAPTSLSSRRGELHARSQDHRPSGFFTR